MEIECLDSTLPDQLFELYLPNDVRIHTIVDLTPGRLYEIQLS